MKLISKVLFILITQLLLASPNLIEKTKEISYLKEENNIKVKDFCMKLTSESNIVIIPDVNIENEKINIEKSTEDRSVYDILKICCYKYHYIIEEKNKYIYITKESTKNSSEGIVIGSVYDKKYNTNLSGVEINIVGEKYKKYISDENGKFILDNIPYGIYFISLKKNGYVTEGELLEVNKNNNTIRISMEQTNIKNRDLKKKDDDFIIRKVKINNLKEIDINELLQEKKNMVNISKNLKENIVYISGKEEKVNKIKKYLNSIDNNNRQVRITAKIIDVTENLFEKLGFSWIYDENINFENNKLGFKILDNNGMIGIDKSYSTFASLLKTFKNDKEFLKFSLDLLQTTQDLKITSVPSIVTVNGEIGEIKITEEKIVGQEKEETENNKITYYPIFKEAGIVLRVIPEIMSEELINLKLEIESSDFKSSNLDSVNSTEDSVNLNEGSKISRILKTTLKVKEGNEILIGGLKKEVVKKSINKVPIISSIPLVGNLFKYKSKEREKVDLYIKLKVDIIKNQNKY